MIRLPFMQLRRVVSKRVFCPAHVNRVEVVIMVHL
jgi:hypothetical protein